MGMSGMPFPTNLHQSDMGMDMDMDGDRDLNMMDIGGQLSRMRILPSALFPGFMYGGALMNENLDYETLMNMFPPAPTGAQETDIQQLPVDTFKAKPKEKEHTKDINQEEKDDKKRKKKRK